MDINNRKVLNKSVTGFGYFSIFLLALSLLIILLPIIINGLGAFFFKGTVEFRRVQYEKFNRGNNEDILAEINKTNVHKNYIYKKMHTFMDKIDEEEIEDSYKYEKNVNELYKLIKDLIGPPLDEDRPVLIREQYGETRWDKAEEKLDEILYKREWDYTNKDKIGRQVKTLRLNDFKGTEIEDIFRYIETNIEAIMLPEFTFYYNFLFDKSYDAHFFGGIWPEFLGTFYLALGAMIFAVPMGIIAAIYLAEYSKEGKILSILRTFISTLSGVPSIVFGLFGLAFFINTMKVSDSKSVLAGALTLALLILPTVIRSSEEAILAVPDTYREASLALGTTKLKTIIKVILPAALPGILTGVIISLGRAAGETAPIIFTAAVSVGSPLSFGEIFNQPSPALSWNIYNLVTEHEAVNEIRHVQYGMVFSLVLLVLSLNLVAVILRARITKKLRG